MVDGNLAREEARNAQKHSELISQRLRELREAKGLSQIQLAAASGVERGTINRIENNNQVATLSTLEKLAVALEVELVALLM